MRTCVKCGELFDKRHCPACNRAYQTEYRAKHPEKKKASNAAYKAKNPEKFRADRAKYTNENRDKVNAYAKAYRAANPIRMKLADAAWYAANAEKKAAYHAAYSAANPDVGKRGKQNRRARKKGSAGKLSRGLAVKLYSLQGGKCACGCKQPLGDKYHLDHVMPLALGGANEDWNIQLLLPVCNQRKHASHPIDFMRSRGFLL